MNNCDCDNCFTVSYWNSGDAHVINSRKYCACDKCFENEVLDPIHNGELFVVYDLINDGFVYEMLNSNKRLVDTLETLILDTIFYEEFRLDVIKTDGHDKRIREKVDYIGLLDHLFDETDLYIEERDYVMYALNFIHTSIFSVDRYNPDAVDKIHKYFVDALIQYQDFDKQYEDYYITQQVYNETIINSLKAATVDGCKETVEMILKKIGTQKAVEQLRNKEHLEELDQVFWQPDGIRYFELERHFNRLKLIL